MPDIVFLDIGLPKLDGLGVLEALRADPAIEPLPVVILSNFSERELIDRGAKLGALDHLIKSARRRGWSAASSAQELGRAAREPRLARALPPPEPDPFAPAGAERSAGAKPRQPRLSRAETAAGG